MELKHSIIRVALRRDSIIQVKTVALIALIALPRKFVILDAATTEATKIAALALGGVYWLLCESDRLVGATDQARGDEREKPHDRREKPP